MLAKGTTSDRPTHVTHSLYVDLGSPGPTDNPPHPAGTLTPQDSTYGRRDHTDLAGGTGRNLPPKVRPGPILLRSQEIRPAVPLPGSRGRGPRAGFNKDLNKGLGVSLGLGVHQKRHYLEGRHTRPDRTRPPRSDPCLLPPFLSVTRVKPPGG